MFFGRRHELGEHLGVTEAGGRGRNRPTLRSCSRPRWPLRTQKIMPDQYQQFTTDDGWVVNLTITNEVIDHIDNIAGARQFIASAGVLSGW